MKRLIIMLLVVCSSLNMYGQAQNNDSVRVGVFEESSLPDSFDGGLGYFYLSDKAKQDGQYVFVFDLGTSLAVVLDGNFLVLPMVKSDGKQDNMVFQNNDYRVKVSIESRGDGGYESSTYTGYAVVESLKKGIRTSRIRFVGECSM